MNLSTIRWRAFFGTAALACLSVLGANAQSRQVTLRLNTATLPDTIKTNDVIKVMGAYGGQAPFTLPDGKVISWDTGGANQSTLNLQNVGGDYWQIVFRMPTTDKLTFKFFSTQAQAGPLQEGWEADPNPEIAAGTADVVMPLHYYESQKEYKGVSGDRGPYDWRPFPSKTDSVAVHFRVYMATYGAESAGFDPNANQQVFVRGDDFAQAGPLDWGLNKLILTRESSDKAKPGYYLYSGTAYYAKSLVGNTQNYKYAFQNGGNVGWENDPNRSFKIPANDTTLHWDYFSRTNAKEFAPRATAAVTFTTDLTALQNLGLFDRASGDSIEVRGAFNGWDCAGEGSPDDCLLRRRPIGNLYDLGYTFVNTAVGSEQEYKYYVNFRDDVFRQRFGRTPPSGWEENINNTGINRKFTFTGQASQTGTQFFQGILPSNVIPNGTTVNTTFRVDMRPALTFAGQPFVPATDSVFILFGDPFWVFTQGDPLSATGDPIHLTKYTLTDPDGDRVYTGTFPVRGATINGIPLATYSGVQYQYQFGNATKGYYTEAGTGTATIGRRRTRFIVPTGPNTWPSTYNITNQPEVIRPTGALPYECNPGLAVNDSQRPAGCVASQSVAVERVDAAASAVSVNAYPNPSTGTTRFRFDVPQTGYVSLKLYDTMGRMVASVVDGVQATGTYTTTFDTAGLAAGVYVYRLTVGGASVARTLVVAN